MVKSYTKQKQSRGFNWHQCLFVLLLLCLCPLSLQADCQALLAKPGFTYTRQTTTNQTIHIFTVNPTFYQIDLIKAHETVFGRETLDQIAQRSNALLAVNGGFFEMGDNRDGQPAGTLKINEVIYTLQQTLQTLLLWDATQASIQQGRGELVAMHQQPPLHIDALNQMPNETNIIAYNEAWGKRTRTPYHRQELTIDAAGHIMSITAHGDTIIPTNGWVVSFPAEADLSAFKPGDTLTISTHFAEDQQQARPLPAYALQGIPLLVKKGQIDPHLAEHCKNKDFVEGEHARTAVGIKNNGDYLFVLVENNTRPAIKDITLGEVNQILRQENKMKDFDILTLPEVRQIVTEHVMKDAAQQKGMSLKKLATLLVKLGAESAMNLDGGTSTSFYLQSTTPPAQFSYHVATALSNVIVVREKNR